MVGRLFVLAMDTAQVKSLCLLLLGNVHKLSVSFVNMYLKIRKVSTEIWQCQ